MALQNHPERATLAYILFSYHLKLGHNDDAYDAMVSNPDKMRRKDSLRQFLVTLFDRGELAVLSGYPYIDMLDDVENIIESRARSADLSVNNYYDFLYSFHIAKENYRKAAHVMYECGSRLGLELNNLQGLKKQAQSYLACINSLRLVNKKYQWIVKPGHGMANGKSPKRSYEGEERELTGNSSIEVIELEDIEKELILTQARLKLCGSGDNMSSSLPLTPGLTPAETVALLTGSNLYMDAVNICKIYSLATSVLVSVVQGLALKCAKLSQGGRGGDIGQAWTWLADNRQAGGREVGEDAVEAAWQLLEHIVTSHEQRGCTALHRAVLCKLSQSRCAPPPWLVAGYKMKDCSELIRVYHQLGYIEQAGEVAIQYITAVMGDGAEYFGLSGGLTPTSPPAWVPWTVLDRLVLELRENREHPGVRNVLERLQATVDVYLQTVDDVSRKMISVRAG